MMHGQWAPYFSVAPSAERRPEITYKTVHEVSSSTRSRSVFIDISISYSRYLNIIQGQSPSLIPRCWTPRMFGSVCDDNHHSIRLARRLMTYSHRLLFWSRQISSQHRPRRWPPCCRNRPQYRYTLLPSRWAKCPQARS